MYWSWQLRLTQIRTVSNPVLLCLYFVSIERKTNYQSEQWIVRISKWAENTNSHKHRKLEIGSPEGMTYPAPNTCSNNNQCLSAFIIFQLKTVLIQKYVLINILKNLDFKDTFVIVCPLQDRRCYIT